MRTQTLTRTGLLSAWCLPAHAAYRSGHLKASWVFIVSVSCSWGVWWSGRWTRQQDSQPSSRTFFHRPGPYITAAGPAFNNNTANATAVNSLKPQFAEFVRIAQILCWQHIQRREHVTFKYMIQVRGGKIALANADNDHYMFYIGWKTDN